MTETRLMAAKATARTEARARRNAAHKAALLSDRAGPGEAVRRRFMEIIAPGGPLVGGAAGPLAGGAAVSVYWPVRSEIDTRPLLATLDKAGHVCALPVILAKGQPLIFRRWRPGAALVARPFGLLEPGPEIEEVVPTVVVVPLLAFDAAGRRLGYGGGFYDRTLAKLRGDADRPVLAVGVAYAAQQWERVPAGAADEGLDWVVTEKGAIRCAPLQA